MCLSARQHALGRAKKVPALAEMDHLQPGDEREGRGARGEGRGARNEGPGARGQRRGTCAPLSPRKQSRQQGHVPFQRHSHRFDAELGLARRIIVRRDGTEIGLLDARNSSRTEDLFDLLQERAGQQRLRDSSKRGVTQTQTFVGPGDRLVEQQHLFACAFGAGRQTASRRRSAARTRPRCKAGPRVGPAERPFPKVPPETDMECEASGRWTPSTRT